MKDRQTPDLGWPPEDPYALAGFPFQVLRSDRPLFRVARAGNGPWWFGSSMEGRFDLPPPGGTCYLGTDEISALLEVIGPDLEEGAIPSAFLRARRLHRLHVPEPYVLSDLTSRRITRFGLTAEIGTIVPYACPQAWAVVLYTTGSGGILYWLRHDPSRQEGIALFGLQGERTDWDPGQAEEITGDEILDRLFEECGIEVLDVPRSQQLRIIGD